jgi:RNA polymerase primary sigma factor
MLAKSENHAESNLKFALSRAHRYKQYGNFDEIVSAANYGLVKAAEKFDSRKKVKFISYAVHWIDKYIKEYLSERSVRIPNSQLGKLGKINKYIEEFKGKRGREPSTEEICKAMKMKPLSVHKTMNVKVQSVVSLNKALDEDSDGTFEQLLPDGKPAPDATCDQLFRSAAVSRAIGKLPKLQADVIRLYFYDDLGFTDIAEQLDIPYATARDSFKEAMSNLKNEFKGFDLCV